MRRTLLLLAIAALTAIALTGSLAGPALATTAATCPTVAYPPTMPPPECRPDDPGATTSTARGLDADDGDLAHTGVNALGPLLRIALVALALGALTTHAARVRAQRTTGTSPSSP